MYPPKLKKQSIEKLSRIWNKTTAVVNIRTNGFKVLHVIKIEFKNNGNDSNTQTFKTKNF